jgi:hypothetical protein
MMKMRRFLSLMLASCSLVFLLATGCATAPPDGTIYAPEGPPAMQTEVVGVAPETGMVWVGGYWNWAAPNYVWVPGTWQRPPRERAVWVAPEWRHHSNGWWRVDGHWR